MRNGHKVYFLTFADSRLACKDIIKKQAVESGFFDEICAYDEKGFDKWYLEKYADRLVLGSRGFGYMQWKPYLIRKVMDLMDEGDYLVYADAGCTINGNGKNRFVDYLAIVEESKSGMMAFQEEGKESAWTKGDVFEYFGVLEEKEYIDHCQVASGAIFLRKCWYSQQIIDEWYYICHNKHDLTTDSPSIHPNFPDFQENRHDQSIFSMLSIKYQFALVPVTEFFSENGYDNDTMKQYPIWATRYKPKKHSRVWKIYHKLKKK